MQPPSTLEQYEPEKFQPLERSLTGAREMWEKEAAAEKLQPDHKHPFPIHTALFGREKGGLAGKEGVTASLEKRVGWRTVLL